MCPSLAAIVSNKPSPYASPRSAGSTPVDCPFTSQSVFTVPRMRLIRSSCSRRACGRHVDSSQNASAYALEGDAAVRAAETERIRQGGLELRCTRNVRHVVEVARRVLIFEVD